MKLGLVSAILDWMSFEEMIDTISSLGYECVEAACWPSGKAERRYAGVSHIDVDELSEAKAEYILNYCKEKNVEISSLAFYPNTMDGDLEKRKANIEHLKKVIAASQKLGIGMVTTFIGRDHTKSVEENLKLFEEIWPDIIRFAEEHQVKVAIENCPMLFDETQWPGGQNLATTPKIWRRMFEIIPSGIFGLRHQCGDRGCQETGICFGRGKEEGGEYPEPAGGIKGRYGSLCEEAGRQSVLPGRGAGTAGKPDYP